MTPVRRILLWSAIALFPPRLAAAQSAHAVVDTAPVWSSSDWFWFRRPTANGNVWMSVDAKNGTLQPLFDHERLAIELSQTTKTEYTANTLPFAELDNFAVKLNGKTDFFQHLRVLEFVFGDSLWRCDLDAKWSWKREPPSDYECKPRTTADAAEPVRAAGPKVSPDGALEALIVNDNVVVRPAGSTSTTQVRRLSTDGTTDFSYLLGSIKWSPDSRTVSAYRVKSSVWHGNAYSANVRDGVVKGEWPVPDKRVTDTR